MRQKKMTRMISTVLALSVFLSGCSAREGEKIAETEPPAAAVEEPSALIIPVDPSPEPAAETVPIPEAQQLLVPVTRNGYDVSGNLSDHELWSYQFIREDDRFEVGSLDGETIHSLYLVWTERPLPYAIVYPDGSSQQVEGEMLHQVVHLEKPSSLVSIAVSYAGTRLSLNEVSAYSEGTLPTEVQDWQRLGMGEADICLFPTHADDEFVFFGGILPYYAGELGCKVQVCWMCCHDNDIRRNHELLNALWLSGCRYYPEINYNALDYACSGYEEAENRYTFEQFEKYQVEMIRKYRPFVIVGHDEKGEYGHGAHMLASVTLEQAAVDAADPRKFAASFAEYGAWDTPKTYIHLYGDEPTILDYDLSLKSFDGLSAYEAALACYGEHRSQVTSSLFTVYRSDSPYDSARFGLQRTTVGRDEKRNDLLEHIDLEQEKTGEKYVPTRAAESAQSLTNQVLDAAIYTPCEYRGRTESVAYTATDIATCTSIEKTMLVYLPYGYDQANQYNVLVLTQGASGDENYWFRETKDEKGNHVSLRNLMDNMIAWNLCEPLIVVSVDWSNTASCRITRFDIYDLDIASAQLATELSRYVLPCIVDRFSTYAEDNTESAIQAARDHFAFAGLDWGAMSCILGVMREDLNLFSWFGSFAPDIFDLKDTASCIDKTEAESHINFFLMICGSDDSALLKSRTIYDRLTDSAEALSDSRNCKFIEVQDGTHWYGTWMNGLYNSLLVFFR